MNYKELYSNQNYLKKAINIKIELSLFNSYMSGRIIPFNSGYYISEFPYKSNKSFLNYGVDLQFLLKFSDNEKSDIFLWSIIELYRQKGDTLILIDSESGKEIERIQFKNFIDFPSIIENDFYFSYISASDFINKKGLKKKTFGGEELWSCQLQIVRMDAWNDEFIYCFTYDSLDVFFNAPKDFGLCCISNKDGKIIWQIPSSFDFNGQRISDLLYSGRTTDLKGIQLHDNGILLVRSKSQGIFGINAKNGTVLWNWKPDLDKIIPIREKNWNSPCIPTTENDHYFMNVFSYSIDYEGIVHILNHEFYTQIDSKTGREIREFQMHTVFRKAKINRLKENHMDFIGKNLAISKTHLIASIYEKIIFINKSTGNIDKILQGEDTRNGIIDRILITGEDILVTIERCGTRRLNPNYLKIWKAV